MHTGSYYIEHPISSQQPSKSTSKRKIEQRKKKYNTYIPTKTKPIKWEGAVTMAK